MAANFGDTIMEGEIAPSVEVQAPVVDKSGLYLAEAAGHALEGIGSIFGGVMKANAQNEANSVLVGFREQALLIADAVDQGGIGTQAARTRWRQLYSETLANNPGLAEDLDKLNSTLLSENGIAHVVQTGNEQVQRDIALQDSAYAAGWVAPNGQPDVEGYTNFQVATRQLETAKSELARKTAELGYVSALDEANMRTSVNQWAKAGIPWVDQQIALAAQQIDAGADVAETIAALRADIGTVTGDLSANSQGIKLEHILTPIEQRLTRFEEMATGKLSTEVYNSHIASIKARQEYAYRMDPELGTLLTMSELFGANAPTAMIQQKLNDRASQLLVAASQPFDASSDSNPAPPDLIGSDGDTVAAVKSLQEMLESASVAPTPEVVEEVQTNIINVLRSIKRNQGDNPLDYKVVIDMFASQGMGKWAESNLIIPEELKGEALNVVRNQYENVLLPLVEERYTSAMATLRSANLDFTTGGSAAGGTSENLTNVGVSELIIPVWNGSNVSFQPAPGYEENATAKGMAASLNEGEDGIAAPLNTLIRAKAHMKGTTDYTAEWEFLSGRLFPEPVEEGSIADRVNNALNYAPSPTEGNDALAAIDANISDFNEELVANYIVQNATDDISAAEYDDVSGTLIGFEGFSATPYWDVNAYRVGFGSDTITKEDGSVVKVRPGMTVTKADAQRDLTRRLNEEFIPNTIKQVGEEVWGGLPPAAKTALASIAYNYGSIGPDGANIADAVKTGDLEIIAAAVERLKTHNRGINAKRRQAEADMIRRAA